MTSVAISAAPTKRFFVEMLTRDISLKDAILDLLDNCIDGILRETEGQKKPALPYKGYSAKITLSPKEFIIEDNCGGISKKIAHNAFRLGRVDESQDEKIATVGMYGIGMKRAIFKMGERCNVVSRNADKAFIVKITPEWLKKEKGDDPWKLMMEDCNNSALSQNGLKIHVTELHDGIAYYFDSKRSSFIEELKKDISEFFSLILSLGFEVYVNGTAVNPIELKLLSPKDVTKESGQIEPYQFKGKFGDVQVELAVGFYRRLAAPEELDAEDESPSMKNNAGWTIVCNDRVVLHNDTSMVTGWGRNNVPRYHNQFIAIAGIVVFRTVNSMQLPVSTTKRSLDTSSEVYLATLEYMMEGLKIFTSFTNKWKGRSKETNAKFEKLEAMSFAQIAKSKTKDESWTTIRKPKGNAKDAKKYVPHLPTPKDDTRQRLVSFRKSEDEIHDVANLFYEGLDISEIKPSDVGERCFDEFLKKARR